MVSKRPPVSVLCFSSQTFIMQITLVFNVFVTSRQLKGCRCEIWAGRGSKDSLSAGQQLWNVHSSPCLPPFLLRHVSRDDRNRGLAPERLHCEYTPYPGYFVLCMPNKGLLGDKV